MQEVTPKDAMDLTTGKMQDSKREILKIVELRMKTSLHCENISQRYRGYMRSDNAIVSTTTRALGASRLRSRKAMASGCANLIIARAEGFTDARTYLECLKQLALCSCGSEEGEWLFEVCSDQRVDWMRCPLLKRRAPSVMSLSNENKYAKIIGFNSSDFRVGILTACSSVGSRKS